MAGGEGVHLSESLRLFKGKLRRVLRSYAVFRPTEHREAVLREHPLFEQGGDGRGGTGEKGFDVRNGHGLAGLLQQVDHVRLDVGLGRKVGGRVRKVYDPLPLLVNAAAPQLGRDHQPQGVHQQAMIGFLHPLSQLDLLRQQHRIRLHAGQHVLEGHTVLEPAFLGNGEDEPFFGVVPLAEGDQHVMAGAHIQPFGNTIGKRPVHSRVSDIYDQLGKHAAPPFTSM